MLLFFHGVANFSILKTLDPIKMGSTLGWPKQVPSISDLGLFPLMFHFTIWVVFGSSGVGVILSNGINASVMHRWNKYLSKRNFSKGCIIYVESYAFGMNLYIVYIMSHANPTKIVVVRGKDDGLNIDGNRAALLWGTSCNDGSDSDRLDTAEAGGSVRGVMFELSEYDGGTFDRRFLDGEWVGRLPFPLP